MWYPAYSSSDGQVNEHQSEHCTEVRFTLYLTCAYFWIDDVAHLTEAEKEELKCECGRSGQPHIFWGTHVFVSDDMVHHVAGVHHFNAMFTRYVLGTVQKPEALFSEYYIQSDGTQHSMHARHTTCMG